MEELLAEVEELLADVGELASMPSPEAGKEMRLAGHLGWGVLRLGLPRVPGGMGEITSLARALTASRARVQGRGGSLIISQGPPELLQEVGARGNAGGPEARLVEGLKAQFDPSGILSPGRFSR